MVKDSPCTIFIIDDDASIRHSLARLLNSHGYRTETFTSAEEFLDRMPYEGFGCFLLDMELDGLDGLELQQVLLANKSLLPIIFISGKGSISTSVSALRAGALTFLEKPVEESVLMPMIREALRVSEHRALEDACQKEASILFESLSPREMEVFKLVTSGLLNKQIAGELNIAEHTVKLHRQHITTKLGVKSVAEIIQLGQAAGLI
jgi:two-component system response regulator FixJ